MVKTMLPVQRNKDEYEFQEDNNLPVLPSSPMELDNSESTYTFSLEMLFKLRKSSIMNVFMNICSQMFPRSRSVKQISSNVMNLWR